MNTVYLSLGSNIEPEKNLPEAIRRLAQIVQVDEISSVWRTQSIGFPGPEFLNAAVKVKTSLDADSLKDEILCSIEETMGRVRLADKNAPRTIDLDILIFNTEIIDKNLFRLEHLFLPLAELIPSLKMSSNSLTLNEIAIETIKTTKAVDLGHFL
jgi:2-amino-4-hydroxy-6-hydroxymethyldihydropteridine diphosphokinase